MRGLEGKVVLVTGSSSGIGQAIARRLVSEGAKVMVHGLDAAHVQAACRGLCFPPSPAIARDALAAPLGGRFDELPHDRTRRGVQALGRVAPMPAALD